MLDGGQDISVLASLHCGWSAGAERTHIALDEFLSLQRVEERLKLCLPIRPPLQIGPPLRKEPCHALCWRVFLGNDKCLDTISALDRSLWCDPAYYVCG